MHPTPMSPSPTIEPPGAVRSPELRWLGTSWGVTMPAPFEPAPPPEPFMEALRGLAVREVKEPEVFRLFFGRKVRAY